MKLVKFRALFKINEGQLDAFKQITSQFIAAVKEKDQGTLMYDWYLNEETMECSVLEDYADSDAALEHVANLGDLLGKLMELGEMSLELYGSPNEELSKALEGMDAKIFPFYAGL
jgi:quinol monooxygenase YgiN